MGDSLSPDVARKELRAWRTVALVFAALLVAGSTGAAWIMIRDGERIGALEQRLRCWETGSDRPASLVP